MNGFAIRYRCLHAWCESMNLPAYVRLTIANYMFGPSDSIQRHINALCQGGPDSDVPLENIIPGNLVFYCDCGCGCVPGCNFKILSKNNHK